MIGLMNKTLNLEIETTSDGMDVKIIHWKSMNSLIQLMMVHFQMTWLILFLIKNCMICTSNQLIQ